MHKLNQKIKILLGCLALLCCSCTNSAKMDNIAPSIKPRAENCTQLYVLAPENYIVDLAADANVILDPAWHEFIIYCSPSEAKSALNSLAGKLRPEQWRIYSLEGTADELVRFEDGRRILACPAKLAGWVAEGDKE